MKQKLSLSENLRIVETARQTEISLYASCSKFVIIRLTFVIDICLFAACQYLSQRCEYGKLHCQVYPGVIEIFGWSKKKTCGNAVNLGMNMKMFLQDPSAAIVLMTP
ncbi:uncharacterized protein LOC144357852 [Saccoglossus kowalevskii]